MTDIGEAVKFALMDEKVLDCPFKLPKAPDDPKPEEEDYGFDDRITMATAQANSGGKLGDNLDKYGGSPGTDGTWNVYGQDPPRTTAKQVDTARAAERGELEEMVTVDGGQYPYTVAAHHLIPGNASLYESQLFNCYMKKGGKMKVTTPKAMTFTVSHNIGYNVNGSHNGVWLPGSYAIVEGGKHPNGVAWSVLNSNAGNTNWCRDYMAAVTKRAGGQFHDTHRNYNENTLQVLEERAVQLRLHQQTCVERCQKEDQVPPPYDLKARLYRLSIYFRGQTTGLPDSWKNPWFTSDQVATDIWAHALQKSAFMAAYK